MSVFASRGIACSAALFGWLLAAGPANAGVTFCNEFEHAIYVAIAYQQDDGTWLSRGWMYVDPHDCEPFDTALRLKAFYYRAESVTYKTAKGKRQKYIWGDDKKFAIWEDDNFNYWGAEEKVLNSRLEPFHEGPTTDDEEGLTVSIIFHEGNVETVIPAPKTEKSGQSHGSKN